MISMKSHWTWRATRASTRRKHLSNTYVNAKPNGSRTWWYQSDRPRAFLWQVSGSSFSHVDANHLHGDGSAAVTARCVPAECGLCRRIVRFPGMVEDILQVAPATTNIVVVIGASPARTVLDGAHSARGSPFTNRVGFTWFNDLTFDQMLER